MRQTFLFFAGLLFLAIPAIAQKRAILSGTTNENSSIQEVILSYQDKDKMYEESSEVTNGHFAFRAKIKKPVKARIKVIYSSDDVYINPVTEVRTIYLETGRTQIDIFDSLKNAQISGSKLNRELDELNILTAPFNSRISDLQNKVSTLKREGKTEEALRVIKDMEQLENRRSEEVYLPFILSHKKSIVAFSLLEEYAGYDINVERVLPLYNQFSKSIKKSDAGMKLNAQIQIARKLAIGEIAMDFTQNDTSGNPVSLSDFRGQYVLIDFWATWCIPCRIENPNVVRAYQKYKDKNFTVLGISLDREEQKEYWKSAIRNDKLTWTHVSDLKGWNNEVAKQYGIKAIPQNYLLDPEGRIIAKNIKGEELSRTLERVYKSPLFPDSQMR